MLTWIILLPLLGFLINGLSYVLLQRTPESKKWSAGLTGTVASLAIFGAFVCSIVAFFQLKALEPGSYLQEVLFSWIKVEGLNIDFGLRIDALSSLFALVITGVGTLIHVYSIGYMHEDATPGKYFAYLNLFCFAMLCLVLGSSLPVMFLGWEGVGLCSYLLIGYWYEDPEKASAGKKAFIVNRIGDLGFLLGMFMIFTTFGTLDFMALKTAVATATAGGVQPMLGSITAICLLLFVGCTGKSAQIPLYVWLPDAMAGPTPVSALIHAATMVTSGIYLVARLSFMYELSPTALEVMAWIGGLTALFAATMAITQTDIKKVLAYSTVSQLGYMFLACGVAAFDAGVFHVITHAFFKALLFMAAGSVIMGMHHEQDILKMGGLKKYMPRTYLVFAAGWLAICGIFPFSGFFSKDEILWKTFSSPHGSVWLWALAAITAVMTAFYMTRLFVLTFFGKYRGGDDHAHGHAPAHGHGDHAHTPHESPWVVVAPLMILAFLSLVGGFIGIPHLSWVEHWLHPVLGAAPVAGAAEHAVSHVSPSMEWVLMGLSLAGAIIGIFFGFKTYSDFSSVARLKKQHAGVHKLFFNKWYVDEIYEALIVRPVASFSNFLWKTFDVAFIDRVVLGFGRVSEWTGQTMRVIQTGSIQVYAVMFLIGLLVTLGYILHGLH